MFLKFFIDVNLFENLKYVPNHNKAHLQRDVGVFMITGNFLRVRSIPLSIHHENMPMQHTEIFKIVKKKRKFSAEKVWYFSYFCSKHRLWVHVRTASPRRF